MAVGLLKSFQTSLTKNSLLFVIFHFRECVFKSFSWFLKILLFLGATISHFQRGNLRWSNKRQNHVIPAITHTHRQRTKYFLILTQLPLNNVEEMTEYRIVWCPLEMKIEAQIYFQISDQVYVVPRTPCLLSLDSNVSQAFDITSVWGDN